MATSSFTREFTLQPEKVDEFTEEMNREEVSTLSKDFRSKYVSLLQDDEVRSRVCKSLTRN